MALKDHIKPPVFVLPSQSKDKIIDYAVKAGLLVLLYWGGKKAIHQLRHDAAEDRIGWNLETQQASDLRAALNPSGQRWLWLIDGVKTDAIFNVAKNIKNFTEVTQEYRRLYGDSLDNDLNSKLSPENYHRFKNTFKFNSLDPKSTVSPSGLTYKKGLIAISKGQLNVRKTPKAYGSSTQDSLMLFGRSNIITTVEAGTALGITTGRSSFDEKALPSGVLFIEITVLKKSAPIQDAFTAWVAASLLNTITAEAYKQKKYPALAISKEQYDAATSSLNGLQANYTREIITTTYTHVLGDKMQIVNEVGPQIILGYPLLELTTPDSIYIKFLTIDNTQRWVNKKHIKIIER